MLYRGAIGVFVLIFLQLWVGSMTAGAQALEPWVSPLSEPRILRQQSVVMDQQLFCNGTYKYVTITGSDRRACIQGDSPSIATYFDERGRQRAALKRGIVSQYVPVENVCRGVDVCLYSDQNDLLVTKQVGDNLQQQLVFFTRFAERVQYSLLPQPSYAMTSMRPDRVISTLNGSVLSMGAAALSMNGRFIVAELIDTGIVWIDTSTDRIKRILAPGRRYGYGLDPRYELAITENGDTVAVAGGNAGFSIISVDETCGEMLIDPPDRTVRKGVKMCEYSDVGIGNAVVNFRTLVSPKFDDEGRSLSAHALTSTGDDRWVTFVPSSVREPMLLDYLALGDSYASGEGEDEVSRYQKGTNLGIDRCHVSDRSYPFLVARMFRWSVKSVACSGARFRDVEGRGIYAGQAGRLNGTVEQNRRLQSQALLDGLPGRARQSAFVSFYQPRTVTIGIGGNDAGILDKLRACAMPGECEWATIEKRRVTAAEIDRLLPQYRSLFAGLKTASPKTTFFAIGYPLAINKDNTMCDVATQTLFTQGEKTLLYWSIHRLNTVMRQAALETGITFVDTSDAFAGNELCTQNSRPSMNALRIEGFSVASESYHPTPFGHALIASLVETALTWRNATCTSTCNISGDSYWNEAKENDTLAFASSVVDESCRQACRLTVPDYTFAPSSDVTVVLRSSPRSLGVFKANARGGLEARVDLPGDLTGYHTLHLYGTSATGESVDLYQTIGFLKTEPVQQGQGVERTQQTMSVTIVPSPPTLPPDKSLSIREGVATNPSYGLGKKDENSIWPALLFIPTGIISVWLLYALWLRSLFQRHFLRR